MKTFKDRLVFLWQGAKPSEIAADLEMSQPGFARVWKEDAIPKAETLIKIKEKKQCSLDWLLTGEGNPYIGSSYSEFGSWGSGDINQAHVCRDTLGNPVDLTAFIFVPRYNLQASAGHGSAVAGEVATIHEVFPKSLIDKHHHIDPKNLSVITVKGDSMEGVLNNRDVILLNHADTNPGAGLYVLRVDGELIVKRVQRIPGGKLRVASANEAYEPFEVDLSNPPDDFAVIGKVVWFGRML